MPTKIEWAEESWNPITGCTPVSEGCVNCYAKRMAYRLRGRFGYPEDEPFRVTVHPDRLKQPLRWKKPRRIFVCSMGDLFHSDVSHSFQLSVFAAMYETPQHTFLLLTKRVQNMHFFVETVTRHAPWPEHIWLGVSAENQQRADERIPILLGIPAAVRFVSCEPLLGPIDLCDLSTRQGHLNALAGHIRCECGTSTIAQTGRLHWVIIGGESGPHARPMQPQWARDIRDDCHGELDDVAVFVKQMSGREPIPPDLMVREYP